MSFLHGATVQLRLLLHQIVLHVQEYFVLAFHTMLQYLLLLGEEG